MKKLMIVAIGLLLVGCGPSRVAVEINDTDDRKPYIKEGKGVIELIAAIEGSSGPRLYQLKTPDQTCIVLTGGESRGSVSCVATK